VSRKASSVYLPIHRRRVGEIGYWCDVRSGVFQTKAGCRDRYSEQGGCVLFERSGRTVVVKAIEPEDMCWESLGRAMAREGRPLGMERRYDCSDC
jgi:hypothetical protein